MTELGAKSLLFGCLSSKMLKYMNDNNLEIFHCYNLNNKLFIHTHSDSVVNHFFTMMVHSTTDFSLTKDCY